MGSSSYEAPGQQPRNWWGGSTLRVLRVITLGVVVGVDYYTYVLSRGEERRDE